MWGKAHMPARERLDQVVETAGGDPFADLHAVETLRKSLTVKHQGSVHQVVAEEATYDEPEPEPESANAKYWRAPRLNLGVARRFVAMVIMLSMFAGGTGGTTVAVDIGRLVG